MAYTCRILILVEVDENGNIIRQNSATGHYQMEIFDNHSDSNFTSRVGAYYYTNPVFSYGGANNSQGYLTIFDYANQNAVRPNAMYKLYSIDFQASNAAIAEFKSGILDHCNPFTAVHTSISTKYEVNSGTFETYTRSAVNCFRAVAVWSKSLGNDMLWNIYQKNDTSNSYPDYIAWKMYDKYGSQWDYRGMWIEGTQYL